jgi:hypothetical protein
MLVLSSTLLQPGTVGATSQMNLMVGVQFASSRFSQAMNSEPWE